MLIDPDCPNIECYRLNERGNWELFQFAIERFSTEIESCEVELASVGFKFLLSLLYEDVELLPGLQAQITNSQLGTYGPTNTLPNTFDPVAQDNFGNAFDAGVWDGRNVLINTGTNRSGSYTTAGNWGDITLRFEGAEYVGFSLEQMQ